MHTEKPIKLGAYPACALYAALSGPLVSSCLIDLVFAYIPDVVYLKLEHGPGTNRSTAKQTTQHALTTDVPEL